MGLKSDTRAPFPDPPPPLPEVRGAHTAPCHLGAIFHPPCARPPFVAVASTALGRRKLTGTADQSRSSKEVAHQRVPLEHGHAKQCRMPVCTVTGGCTAKRAGATSARGIRNHWRGGQNRSGCHCLAEGGLGWVGCCAWLWRHPPPSPRKGRGGGGACRHIPHTRALVLVTCTPCGAGSALAGHCPTRRRLPGPRWHSPPPLCPRHSPPTLLFPTGGGGVASCGRE